MLRFISHFTVNGESWLISLNYLGHDYLAELDNQYNWNDGQNWLVNNEGGNWLLGPHLIALGSLCIATKKTQDQDFFQTHPSLWKKNQIQ